MAPCQFLKFMKKLGQELRGRAPPQPRKDGARGPRPEAGQVTPEGRGPPETLGLKERQEQPSQPSEQGPQADHAGDRLGDQVRAPHPGPPPAACECEVLPSGGERDRAGRAGPRTRRFYFLAAEAHGRYADEPRAPWEMALYMPRWARALPFPPGAPTAGRRPAW